MTPPGPDIGHPGAEPPPDAPVVLFDGECNLCHRSVQFLLRHDRRKALRFASLQGDYGRRLLARLGQANFTPDSFLLQADGRVYRDSGAALRTLRLLGPPWSLLYALLIVPAPLRDAVYRYIARNRYRWFGRRDTCWMPTPERRARFLD
jgi:predicted DCC family thiol-disulfide oxidoreductase YuxK